MKNRDKIIKDKINTPEKKETIKFIQNVKNDAKNKKISYNMRIADYNISNQTIYSYGVR